MTLRADLNHSIALLAEAGSLRVADGLAVWLAGETMTLESALGVASTWRSQTRRRRRDEIYAEIARTYFPHLAGHALADAMTESIRRYEQGQWNHDSEIGARPNELNGLAFDLLMLGGKRLEHDSLRKRDWGKNPAGIPQAKRCVAQHRE